MLTGFLAGMVLFGIAYLKAGLASWLGYQSVGASSSASGPS
jgi:hypothetical protein